MKKIIIVMISFLIAILVLLFTFLSIAGCKSATPKQLDVQVWEGYLPDEVAALFEQETGIKLNITFISDNDRMVTFLKGGGKADIVMPTDSTLIRIYQDSLGQPLDLDKIPNYKNVSKFFKNQPWSKWDGSQMGSGEVYAIPFVFGANGFVVNTSKYTKSLDNIGWEILFDTDLKGRTSSYNGIPSLLIMLDLLGIPREDLLTDTEGTLEKVKDTAIAFKNNVLKFYDSGAEIFDLMKNEEVWVSHIEDGNGRKLSRFDAKFKFVLPKTGGMAFTDTFVIPKEAVNPSGANLFIDFMLRPDIAAMLTDQSGYTTTIEGALDMTKKIDKDLYRFTDEQLEKLRWTPGLPQEVRSEFGEFWEELKNIK